MNLTKSCQILIVIRLDTEFDRILINFGTV